MMKQLREQVNGVLTAVSCRRRPALRRSDAAEALLATDLPFAADADAVEEAVRRLTALGWRVWLAENGWLLLDAAVPAPQAALPCAPQGECGCCITILLRHPESGDARVLIRAAVKAEEAGRQYFDRFCAQLHGELAARLRRHKPLPGGLLPYLCRAYETLQIGRTSL